MEERYNNPDESDSLITKKFGVIYLLFKGLVFLITINYLCTPVFFEHHDLFQGGLFLSSLIGMVSLVSHKMSLEKEYGWEIDNSLVYWSAHIINHVNNRQFNVIKLSVVYLVLTILTKEVINMDWDIQNFQMSQLPFFAKTIIHFCCVYNAMCIMYSLTRLRRFHIFDYRD